LTANGIAEGDDELSYIEDFEDVGGDQANCDAFITSLETRVDIEEDRQKRKRYLIGKYVVVYNGKVNPIFLQDQRISKKHNWTKFLSNAISFLNAELAQKEADKFKYNNPRIAIVDARYNLVFFHETHSITAHTIQK
jgi:hypothetical protein